jgi:uncharacterized protein (DUF1810 family)
MTFDLERFKKAQESSAGYRTALAEIRAGGKRSHWIWYVFPQLVGLGGSSMAQLYGIDGSAEAIAYLQDPDLRGRLLTIAEAVAEQMRSPAPPMLATLMGSDIDARKLVSSMTLFGSVARRLEVVEPGVAEHAALAQVAEEILAVAAAEGFSPCSYTRSRLAGSEQR